MYIDIYTMELYLYTFILGIENYFRDKINAKFVRKNNASYITGSTYEDKDISLYIYIYDMIYE